MEISRRDIIVVVAFLALSIIVGGYAWIDIALKRAALKEFSQIHVEEHFEGLPEEEFERLVDLSTGKALTFFGKDWGVMRLYTRRKNDKAMESFIGVEYFYEHENGKWALRDHAQIKLPEHIYEGYTKFEEAGFAVDDEAYLRYNR